MSFIRTASTRRLIATLAGLVAVIVAGAAIAVAATGPGQAPPPRPLADALHRALTAPPVAGITADISFTNNLIGSQDFTGGASDPLLQGASGRLWATNDGRLRLELQSSNGDAQVVVGHGSFWISDPSSQTVYEGTMPASKRGPDSTANGQDAIPSVGRIQSGLDRLMGHLDISGAIPGNVGGQPAYTVRISPRHDGGLLGSLQLAWDANHGVPLSVAVYARGNATPVLALRATNVSYGTVPASVFEIQPPAGYKVVRIVAPPAGTATAGRHAHRPAITGAGAVARAVSFTLADPASLVGLPRQSVRLLDWGGRPAALVTYGHGLGAIAVVEQSASQASTGPAPSIQSGSTRLSLPSVSIDGSTAQELATPLGTVLRFSRGGVAYTVLGSVPAVAAEAAARGL